MKKAGTPVVHVIAERRYGASCTSYLGDEVWINCASSSLHVNESRRESQGLRLPPFAQRVVEVE